MRDYPQYKRELDGTIRNLRAAIPGTTSGYGELRSAALAPGSLSTATKELIALGIAIGIRCEGCITYHVMDALKAGASKEEIAEAIGVAILMGGGPSLVYGAQAFEALGQFDANRKLWALAGD